MHLNSLAIKKKIEEINTSILSWVENDYTEEDTLSLMAGLPGACLFLYEYCKYHPENTAIYYEKIGSIIENAFAFIDNSSSLSTTYCDGINGLLWLTEYLRSKEVIVLENDYISQEIIQLLN